MCLLWAKKKEMLLNQYGVYKYEGYWIASLERAICDTSYLEPSFVFENVDKADTEELEWLSHLYDNRALYDRIQKLISTMLEKEE